MEKQEIYKRVLKFLAIFLIVFVSTITVSSNKLHSSQILILSMLITFGITFLDLYYPSVCIAPI